MPEPLERALKAESAARGHVPLRRRGFVEGLAEDIGGFYERGGLAGLAGMQPVDEQLAEDGRRFQEDIRQGRIRLSPGAVDIAMNFSPAALGGMIKAWHGTPHKFEKFDMNRIGTGEGAQAYGHGLYLAGNQGVAQSYGTAGIRGSRLQYKGEDIWKALERSDALPETKKALNWLKDEASLDDALVNAENSNVASEIQRLVKSGEITELPKGNLYQVDIDTHADELLDWDKPLSEQSEKVQAAIKELARVHKLKSNIPGYEPKGGEYLSGLEQIGGKEFASQELREAGIKGIRYLDQGSRGAGEGTHNYVVFDDDILKIVGQD